MFVLRIWDQIIKMHFWSNLISIPFLYEPGQTGWLASLAFPRCCLKIDTATHRLVFSILFRHGSCMSVAERLKSVEVGRLNTLKKDWIGRIRVYFGVKIVWIKSFVSFLEVQMHLFMPTFYVTYFLTYNRFCHWTISYSLRVLFKLRFVGTGVQAQL